MTQGSLTAAEVISDGELRVGGNASLGGHVSAETLEVVGAISASKMHISSEEIAISRIFPRSEGVRYTRRSHW